MEPRQAAGQAIAGGRFTPVSALPVFNDGKRFVECRADIETRVDPRCRLVDPGVAHSFTANDHNSAPNDIGVRQVVLTSFSVSLEVVPVCRGGKLAHEVSGRYFRIARFALQRRNPAP